MYYSEYAGFQDCCTSLSSRFLLFNRSDRSLDASIQTRHGKEERMPCMPEAG
jgi:hypothetical protein